MLFFSCRYPAGFRIGKLESHHSEFVSSELGIPRLWIKQQIENLHSSAAFLEENPDLPVSWNIEHQNREIGHAYTLKEYRNRGLVTIVTDSLIKSLQEDCYDIPPFTTVEEGSIGHSVIRKRFIQCGVMACYI